MFNVLGMEIGSIIVFIICDGYNLSLISFSGLIFQFLQS